MIGVICIKTIALAFSDAKVSRRKLPQFLHHTLPILDFSLPDASHLPFHSAVIISHFIPHDMLRQARLGFSTTKALAAVSISIILHPLAVCCQYLQGIFCILKMSKDVSASLTTRKLNFVVLMLSKKQNTTSTGS